MFTPINLQSIVPPKHIETENIYIIRTSKRIASANKAPLEKYAATAGTKDAPDSEDIVEAVEQVEQNVSRAMIVGNQDQFIITLPDDQTLE
jgi:predicted HAD superfamily hydrolase